MSTSAGAYYFVALNPSGCDLDLFGDVTESVSFSRGSGNNTYCATTGTYPEYIEFQAAYGGHYYFSVHGATGGSFQIQATQLPAPTVQTTQPNVSGTVWNIGESKQITWNPVGSFLKYQVQLSRDGGQSWSTLATPSILDPRSYTWTVQGPVSTNCKIRVRGRNLSTSLKYGWPEKENYGYPAQSYTNYPVISIAAQKTISYLTLSGLDAVDEETTFQYECTATYNDGTTGNATSLASWSVYGQGGSIGSNTGLFTATTVSSDISCQIEASCQGHIARKAVRVRNVAAVDHLTISGQTPIVSGMTAQFSCRAYFVDGTNKAVTEATLWSVSPPAVASIGASTGFLQAQTVSSAQDSTVTASYRLATANKAIQVIPIPPQPPGQVVLSAPADGVLVAPPIQLSWIQPSSPAPIVGYNLEVLDSRGNAQAVSLPASPLNYTISALGAGTYRWRVQANNGSQGPFSAFRSFRVESSKTDTITFNNQVTANDPVNTATGAYTYSRKDLEIPGRGLAMEFVRFYDSRRSGDSVLGPKWRHTFMVSLVEDGNGKVTISWANGASDLFLPGTGGGYENATSGFTGTLSKNSDGTFLFHTKDLTAYRFASNGRLDSIADRHNNRLQLNYDSTERLTSLLDTVDRPVQFNYDGNGRLTMVTDHTGRHVHYAYSPEGDLVSCTDVLDHSIVYGYDTNHRMLTVRDRRDNLSITNGYDDAGRVLTQTNGREKVWQYAYGVDGVTTITDPLSGVEKHAYDDNGWLVRVTDARNFFTEYTYDEQGNRTAVTDKRGNKTEFTFDAHGNAVYVKNPLGNETRWEYNQQDQVTKLTDPLGRVTTFEYDDRGNLTRVVRPLGWVQTSEYNSFGQRTRSIDPLGHETTFTYDAVGNLATMTNALTETTTFAYDALGRITRATEPNTAYTEFTYDAEGNVLTATDQEGHPVSFIYDENGNRTTVTNARLNATQFEYNVHNAVERIIDALDHAEVHEYDDLDRLASITDRRGKIWRYQYDATGNRTKIIDPTKAVDDYTASYDYDANGNRTAIMDGNHNPAYLTYDKLNRLLTSTDALGNTRTLEYDAAGRLTKATEGGKDTEYDYDNLDRRIKITDAEGGIAQFAYDLNGNMTSVTDPNGHTTTFSYDALNRRISETDALGRTVRSTYDNAGNLASRLDARAYLTNFAWTPTHRLTTIAYPDATTVGFAYDENGNRTTMSGPEGTTAWAYDVLDRITAVTDPFTNQVGYGYDATSNRTAIHYDYPANTKTATYTFDDAGRMATVADWAGHDPFTYHYDGAGRVTQLDYPNGCKEKRSYSNNGWLKALSHEKPDTTQFIAYSYSYDASGNITGMDRSEAVEREFAPEKTNYAYNPANEILNANQTRFEFDAAGNQTRKTDATGATTYAYDYENRLTALVPPELNAYQFTYSGTGDRIAASEDGVNKRYLLDINKPLTDVLADLDGGNAPQQYYLYGLDLLGRITPSGDIVQYHPDHIGSIMAVTDQAATLTASFAYDEFGAVAAEDGNEAGPWRFCGTIGLQQLTSEVFFVRARYLDSTIARLSALDKIRRFTTTQRLHNYVMVMNNPLTIIDPSGLEGIERSNSIAAQNAQLLVPAMLTAQSFAGTTPQSVDALSAYTTFFYDAPYLLQMGLDEVCTPDNAAMIGAAAEPLILAYTPLLFGEAALATGVFCGSYSMGRTVAATLGNVPNDPANKTPLLVDVAEVAADLWANTTWGTGNETTPATIWGVGGAWTGIAP
jgi:RHS repeat-associated protein